MGENSYRSELRYCYGNEAPPSSLSLIIQEKERVALIESQGAQQVHATRRPAPLPQQPAEQSQESARKHVLSAQAEAASFFGAEFLQHLVGTSGAAAPRHNHLLMLALLVALAAFQLLWHDCRSGRW